MTVVVVAGSPNSSEFAVIAFFDAPAPPAAVMVPGFYDGNVVACSGTLAAIGDCTNGTVAIYDISNPAAPASRGSVATGLAGIGAISIDGSSVVAGERNGQRVALIDASTTASPSVTSVYSETGLTSISGVALSGTTSIVSGIDGFLTLDCANPASPVGVAYVNRHIVFNGPIYCDFDGTNTVIADGAGNIYVFAMSGGFPVETPIATSQWANGLESVATATDFEVGGIEVATSGAASQDADVIYFNPVLPSINPSSTEISVTLGETSPEDLGGIVKFLNSAVLVTAGVTNKGYTVRLYNVATSFDSSTFSGRITAASSGPAAQVALAASQGGTLGITSITIKLLFPLPWPLRLLPISPWLEKLLQQLFG